MQIHSDRFETVLPKGRFFTPSKQFNPSKQDWRAVIITAICAVTLIAAIKQIASHWSLASHWSPAGVSPVAAPTPVWTAPLPDPKPVQTPALFEPVLNPATPPRAQLVHIRAIGTFENDRMPDGRVLGTVYRGELPNVAHLPKYGNLGDMWFTRADQHCWVLAPIQAGSQITGWIDP
jgi:hypothetical protein